MEGQIELTTRYGMVISQHPTNTTNLQDADAHLIRLNDLHTAFCADAASIPARTLTDFPNIVTTMEPHMQNAAARPVPVPDQVDDSALQNTKIVISNVVDNHVAAGLGPIANPLRTVLTLIDDLCGKLNGTANNAVVIQILNIITEWCDTVRAFSDRARPTVDPGAVNQVKEACRLAKDTLCKGDTVEGDLYKMAAQNLMGLCGVLQQTEHACREFITFCGASTTSVLSDASKAAILQIITNAQARVQCEIAVLNDVNNAREKARQTFDESFGLHETCRALAAQEKEARGRQMNGLLDTIRGLVRQYTEMKLKYLEAVEKEAYHEAYKAKLIHDNDVTQATLQHQVDVHSHLLRSGEACEEAGVILRDAAVQGSRQHEHNLVTINQEVRHQHANLLAVQGEGVAAAIEVLCCDKVPREFGLRQNLVELSNIDHALARARKQHLTSKMTSLENSRRDIQEQNREINTDINALSTLMDPAIVRLEEIRESMAAANAGLANAPGAPTADAAGGAVVVYHPPREKNDIIGGVTERVRAEFIRGEELHHARQQAMVNQMMGGAVPLVRLMEASDAAAAGSSGAGVSVSQAITDAVMVDMRDASPQ